MSDLRAEILAILMSGEYYVAHGEPDEQAQTDAIMAAISSKCMNALPKEEE